MRGREPTISEPSASSCRSVLHTGEVGEGVGGQIARQEVSRRDFFFIVVEKVACGSLEGVTMQHGDSAAQ